MTGLRGCRLRRLACGLILGSALGPLAGCGDSSTAVAPVSDAEIKAKAAAEQSARQKAYGGSGAAVGKRGGLAQPKQASPAGDATSK